MAEVGQREVICREYLEIHCRHNVYLQRLKSHHAVINFRNNLYTESGSRYVPDLCRTIYTLCRLSRRNIDNYKAGLYIFVPDIFSCFYIF